MDILLNPLSQKKYESIVQDCPQGLLLVAPSGSGKETILKQLAVDILGEHFSGRLFEVLPEEGKKTIGIETIRILKPQLRLKSDRPRVVKISSAGLMTDEAQNSLLKLLEDTPNNVHFILSIDNSSDLIETIRSRVVSWRLIPPTKQQILEYYKDYPKDNLLKAIAISENRIGLISALIQDEKSHPLIKEIETAKEILAESKFDRLLRVDALSKDSDRAVLTLEALKLTCKAALENAAINNLKSVNQWQRRLKIVTEAIDNIHANLQLKLVLTYTFSVI